MSASNCQELRFAKLPPKNREKRQNIRDEAAHEKRVYAVVDKRDKLRCKLTGRRGSTTTVSALDRLHHHHIIERSLGGPTESWNMATVHQVVHDLLHKDSALTVSGNADEHLTWTIKASAVLEAFGRKRVPVGVRVIPDEHWQDYIKSEARIRT